MQNIKRQHDRVFRGIGLIMVYGFGFLSIVATGGGSGSGGDEQPNQSDPPEERC
jgi:hypothetical protein